MSNFKDARIVKCTQAEYFAIPAISRSQIVDAYRCPQKYLRMQEKPRKTTPEMAFGTMVHELVLECLEPLRDAVIIPVADCVTAKGIESKVPRSTKAFKDAAEEAAMEGQAVYLDSESDGLIARVRSCAAAVFDEWPRIVGFDASTEVAIVATFTQTGQAVKCRVDSMTLAGIEDLKVTADASPDGFFLKVRKFAYHVQDAFYRDMVSALRGHDDTTFTFCCVEPEGDHITGEYTLNPEWVDVGRDIYERTLMNMAGYAKSGWPTRYGKHELQPKSWDLES